MSRILLPKIIEIVAESLALNWSIVAPAEVVRHGPLWILRDASSQATTTSRRRSR